MFSKRILFVCLCSTKGNDITFTVLQKQSKTRESLQNLQPAATDKENLVGAGRMLKADLPIKDSLKKYLNIFIYF